MARHWKPAINANNKTRRSNKERFLYNTLKKTPSSWKSLIRICSLKWVGWGWVLIWVWLGGGGGGRLFEAGRLLTFSAFRMGAYSRWALIRGWALIRINTVIWLLYQVLSLNSFNLRRLYAFRRKQHQIISGYPFMFCSRSEIQEHLTTEVYALKVRQCLSN